MYVYIVFVSVFEKRLNNFWLKKKKLFKNLKKEFKKRNSNGKLKY